MDSCKKPTGRIQMDSHTWLQISDPGLANNFFLHVLFFTGNFISCNLLYTAKLLTAVRRGSVDVPTQYRHASDPHRRSKKHELRLTQYR